MKKQPRDPIEDRMRRAQNDPRFQAEYITLELLERIIELMEKQDISRADVAKKLGVSRSAVTQTFGRSADRMSVETLVKLAHAVGADLQLQLHPNDTESTQRPRAVAETKPSTPYGE